MGPKMQKLKVVPAHITRLHGLYLCGMSLSKLSKNYGNGLSRQRIHYYFKYFGLSTRPLIRLEKIKYKNSFYSRDCNGYMRKTAGNRRLLHRQLWEDNFGPIGREYDVHHLDGNKTNNDLLNLEKILKGDHTRLYCVFNNQFTKGKKERTIVPDKYCAHCSKIIKRKPGRNPSYYKARKFCSSKCGYSYLKLNSIDIGSRRRRAVLIQKFIILFIAYKLFRGENRCT